MPSRAVTTNPETEESIVRQAGDGRAQLRRDPDIHTWLTGLTTKTEAESGCPSADEVFGMPAGDASGHVVIVGLGGLELLRAQAPIRAPPPPAEASGRAPAPPRERARSARRPSR